MTILVTKEAPNFKANAILANNEIDGNFVLHERIAGKIAVLFFYPLDFTFVCPSELVALGNKIQEFQITHNFLRKKFTIMKYFEAAL